MADNRPKLIEYAGIKNSRDVTRGWVNAVGNYLPTRDSLLNLKSGGDLVLYEQVAQDDQVKSCLQQRFRAVTAKDWEVLPGGDKRIDKQAAEHLKQQLENISWDNCNEKMLWGVFYGYSAAEVLWGRDGDKVVISDIRVRDRRRFHFDIDQKLTLKTFQSPLGETLPERKFWNFCVGADHDDEPYGRGLGHWLYWPTFFKRNGVRWWLKFIEKYAKPTRLGKYPAGATQGEKDVLWNALDSFGDDDRSMIPEGLEMLFLESARNGTVDYKGLCDQMDGSIAKIILSQTMTTDDGSSLSQASVHESVKDEVVESDADLLCESFNSSVATWLTDWNYPGAAYPKVRRKLKPEEDLKASAERDKIIVDMGFPANPEYIVEKYGEGFKQAESELKPNLLNTTELTAFTALIGQAQSGGWSPEMVKVSLEIAFPHVPQELIDKMANSMKAVAAPGADSNNPQTSPANTQTPEQSSQSLDAVAAQFAAPGKKNCKTGLSCGGSCISRLKICDRELDGETRSMVAALRKRIKSGDTDAAGKLDKFRETQAYIKDAQQTRSNKSREALLSEFESATFTNSFETALGIDRDGNQVLRKRGNKDSVSFTAEEVEAVRGGTISHNHPDYEMFVKDDPRSDGNTFSPADIKFASFADLTEIRAVSGKYLHSISRPVAGWPPVDSVASAIAGIKAKNRMQSDIKFMEMYDAPTTKQRLEYKKLVETNENHLVMEEYAKSIRAKYSRIEHGHR